MTLQTLFATQVYEAALGEGAALDAFLAELEDACRMLAAEDRAGRAWCRANGYGGYTSYASLDDLPRRATVFAELKRRLDRHAAAFAEALAYDLGGRRLRLDSLWVNLLKPGGAHSGHIHPNSVLSGVVHVRAPQGSGVLKFEDPRLALMMAAPPLRPDVEPTARRFVPVTPRAGTAFLWESWLRHEVAPNRARSERISVSFNYGWR